MDIFQSVLENIFMPIKSKPWFSLEESIWKWGTQVLFPTLEIVG